MSIRENLSSIRAAMDAAAIAAGRSPQDITLCAATKTQDADTVRRAIAAGITCCGENRVQELTQKLAQNAYEGAQVHFIGRLQTNKVRQVVGKVSLIQSVDRLKLLEAVNAEARKQGIVQDILLQVNIGLEESKGGFPPQALLEVLPRIGSFSHIRVLGLMAIPPISQDSTKNAKYFQEMFRLGVDIRAKKYDNVWVNTLSMGMSEDFESAIGHGSTMVRIGTAIFGARTMNIQEEIQI